MNQRMVLAGLLEDRDDDSLRLRYLQDPWFHAGMTRLTQMLPVIVERLVTLADAKSSEHPDDALRQVLFELPAAPQEPSDA